MNLPKPDFAAPTVYEYTADQLRSYGESCARMAREEAAKLCDEAKATRAESAAQNNGRHSDFAFGYVSAAEEIAYAIRKDLWGTSSISDPAYQQEQREKNEQMRNAVDSLVRKG